MDTYIGYIYTNTKEPPVQQQISDQSIAVFWRRLSRRHSLIRLIFLLTSTFPQTLN